MSSGPTGGSNSGALLEENSMFGRRLQSLGGETTTTGNGEPVSLRAAQLQQQISQPDARFSCSICTEAVMEPVVTHCGHLYCWSCLYRWLENGMTVQERNELFGFSAVHGNNPYYDPSKRVCPVCRAPCSVKRVIPIYVRTETTSTGTFARTTSSSPPPQQEPQRQERHREIDTSNSSRRSEGNDEILNTVETIMNNSDDLDDTVAGMDNIDDDIDENNNIDVAGMSSEENDIHHNPSSSSLHATGIRNRSRIRSSISEASTNSNTINMFDDHDGAGSHTNATVVPRRPVARSSSNLRLEERADVAAAAAFQQQHHNISSSAMGGATTRSTSVSAQHHPASLAHGMLPLVQQAIRHAAIVAGTSSMNNDFVPPLHRLEGMHQNSQNPQQQQQQQSNYGISMEHDQTSPDFLSWILLLLGIFVLACLILF